MKRSFTMFFVLALTAGIWMQTANAQITVSGSITKDGTYTSLTQAAGAFAALNGTSQAGKTIVITITADVTIEDGTNALTGAAGMWTSLTITPVGTRIISGSAAKPLIDLNGADNVTIDGRENGIGITKSLTISNNSTSATAETSTIRFINDACSNTVKFCILKGSSTATYGGIAYLSTTTGTTGNDGNTIDNNDITCSATANRPYCAIFSYGTSLKENSENIFSNNNIFDFLNKAYTSYGIYLGTSATCTILGNSFYETASFASTANTSYYAIYIQNGTGFTISSNFIGGSGPGCTGTWVKTGSFANHFKAIYISGSAGTASEIQGNTIKNFSWTVSTATWTGVEIAGATVANIGTTAGNVIGSAPGINSVIVTQNTIEYTGAVFGFRATSSGTVIIKNNVVGAIKTANNNPDGGTDLYGIAVSGTGNRTISNNLVGSTDPGSSLSMYASSGAILYGQQVCGISNGGNGNVVISENTISRLKNGPASSAPPGPVRGIFLTSGSNTVTGNTICELTANSKNDYSDYRAAVTGICMYSTTAGQTITGNTIYNLSNTYNVSATVAGIFYSSGTSGTNTVSENFIHSLTQTSPRPFSNINGIRIAKGTLTVANNIISIGGTKDCNIAGIYEECSQGSPSFYFNTVYIGGTLSTGSLLTYGLYSTSSMTRDIRNNILYNARTTGSANTNFAIGLSSLTNLTIDYNDYYAPNSGGAIGRQGSPVTVHSTLALWQGYTRQDAHSLNTDPSFALPEGTLPENYRPAISALSGVAGTGTLTDYAGATRSLKGPTMGAYEYNLPVTVTATLGTLSASYQTLKAAFDAINAGTHQGVITVKINTSTTETATAVINASGTGSALYTSVTVYPTASGISVTGDLAAPLIDLNGADNVTIDGRLNASGALKSLMISNTSTSNTAGTSTIRFINDASSNTVKYCTLKGSSTATSGGILHLSTTTGTTGNDGNTIDHNDITNAADANRPVNAILSLGTSGSENSGNTMSNNNIYDFLNRGVASQGIHLSSYTTSSTISGNSFYETQSFTPTASGLNYIVIYINNTSGNSFTVCNNYIGGSAASCGGPAWTKTNAFSIGFNAIKLFVGEVVESDVQGNTIRNFSFSNTGNGSFVGIGIHYGSVNIGTITGNTIGASTGTGSIVLTNSTSAGYFYGIFTTGTSNGQIINIYNNSIGSITTANNPSWHTTIIGIRTSGSGAANIVNNTIGSSTTSNSINAASIGEGAPGTQSVTGIYNMLYGGTCVISKNLIANLTNGSRQTLSTFANQIIGIYCSSGIHLITDNIIHDLTIGSASSLSTAPSACGIYFNVTAKNTLQTVSGNTIYNISNTYPTYAGFVMGIYFKGGEGLASKVSENFIYGLSVNASTTLASVIGIANFSGASVFSNNLVSLGGNSKTEFIGISDASNALNHNISLFHNTVYIGGQPPMGSTNKSYAFKTISTIPVRDFRNNIFVNTRSTPGGANLHYAAYFGYATSTSLTLDYNDYFVSGTGGVLGFYNNLPVTNLPLITGLDANSQKIDPDFASPGGIAPLNYYPSATLNGATGTGIATDFNAYTRSATTPKMGAIESASAPPNTVSVLKANVLQASYPNLENAFDKINDGTHTGSLVLKITASHLLNTSAVLNNSGMGSASYNDITIYPTLAGITVSGNLNAPLIDLNGAENVIIDGRVNATGAVKSLIITNTSTGNNPGTSAIRFNYGASNNTVKYCTLKGASLGTAAAIVLFGTASSVSGNSNNTLDNNNITNAADANRPLNAIYSLGNGTFQNSGNTISNNNVYDFFNRGIVSCGINIGVSSTEWTITGNSFYETASFVPTAHVAYIVINISTTTGNNFTVTNNYIGGSATSCGGTAWTKTNAFDNSFIAISLSTATGTASSVQGNTIQNFSYANAASLSWKGIVCASLTIANIGTIAGNTIGSATGTNSILFTGGDTGSSFSGISISSTGNTTIQNNIIGAITAA
ncbi:MAG: hypothetical protein WCI92_17960, partial [Bacteroidota bacterium]